MEEEINSYEFYVKNFPFIKTMIDEKYLQHTQNILLVIFYDNMLYKKYIQLKGENNFKLLIQNKFTDIELYDNEEYGVFVIGGDLINTIDLVINDIFIENRSLSDKEMKSINLEAIDKNASCFYITMIKIYFFDAEGKMCFKFNEIKNNYSNEENK